MAAPIAVSTTPRPRPSSAAQALHPLAKMRGESRGAAILSEDSLTTYMNQIRRVEVLPRHRQDELARAFVDDNDVEAGKTLIWTNLRYVISVARDFHHSQQDLMELIQEGNLGLSEALVRFDPEQGTSFVGYAQFWIRAMILNHLLNMSQPVRLGASRDSRKLFFNLKKARRAVTAQGMEPTADNVAEYLDVDPEEVVRVGTLMGSGGVVELDAPHYGDDEATTTLDLMESDADRPDDEVAERRFRQRFAALAQDFVETLPDERRVQIWNERMVAVEPRYLKELGADFDVSKERVRQLEMDIRRRFRRFLEDRLGDELHVYLNVN